MNLEINVTSLARDAESVQSNLKSLKNELSELQASMDSLNSSWEGEGKDAYMAGYQQDVEAMNQLCEVLEKLLKFLEYAKDQYNTCDQNVKAAVSAIAI